MKQSASAFGVAALAAGLLLLPVGGCEREENAGVGETAGRKLDQAGEEIGKVLEEAGENIQEASKPAPPATTPAPASTPPPPPPPPK